MLDFFAGLGVLFALWGWTVTIAVAGWLLGNVMLGYWKTGGVRHGRMFSFVVLLLFASGWYQITLPWTFGQTLGVTYTADGERRATIEKSGRLFVVNIYDGQRYRLREHILGRPQQVFWMRDDRAIGVWYRSGKRIMLEVDYLIYAEMPDELKPDDFEHVEDFYHEPAADEIAEFIASRQQAQRLGLIWDNE